MAHIQERTDSTGKTHYRVQVRLKGRPTQSATFERKTDAKRWAQQIETAIREGRHFKSIEAKRHTLDQLIDRYIRDVAPALKTSGARQRQLRWWKEQIGAYTLADITPALIIECRNRLALGQTTRGGQRSPSTANRYMAALSHALTIGMKEWGWLEDNPFRKITGLKEPRGRVRFLEEHERKCLLAACKEHSKLLYTIVVIALSTGARKNEIISLAWPQVNVSRGLITLLDTKNDERRSVPLQEHALELVKEMAKVRRLDTDLLFPSHRNPNKSLSIDSVWRRVVENAELDDFRFHDLRHSAASYLAMNGASLAEIAEVLGHKTLQMVKRYSHLSEQHTAKVVAKMNKQIFS